MIFHSWSDMITWDWERLKTSCLVSPRGKWLIFIWYPLKSIWWIRLVTGQLTKNNKDSRGFYKYYPLYKVISKLKCFRLSVTREKLKKNDQGLLRKISTCWFHQTSRNSSTNPLDESTFDIWVRNSMYIGTRVWNVTEFHSVLVFSAIQKFCSVLVPFFRARHWSTEALNFSA